MKANLIMKLGAVAIVIVSVAIVLRLKHAGSAQQSDAVVSEVALPAPASAEQVDAALPKLLDLGANRCVPCKKMAPILEALREDFEGRFDVVFIDVWKDRQAAKPYGIRVIPTQIFYDAEGNELFRHQGFFSREDILAAWSDLGYEFTEQVPG